MRDHGDNIHMMECFEALRDERYLYIITGKAKEGDLESLFTRAWVVEATNLAMKSHQS